MDKNPVPVGNEDLPVRVDGSFGEGGGQIIRNAVTLACLLRRKIEVINIRANRPNPGLASQHLESIRAMLRISGATTALEPKKQDTQFDLNGTTIPPSADGSNTTIDLVTAGSCTLCIQCILPYLMCLRSPSRISIIGGTHVMKSPSFDYLERVFLPTFNGLLGNNVKAWLKNPGYFPRGGGCINLEVQKSPESPEKKLLPINLTERGEIKRVNAILNITPKMKNEIPQFKSVISADTRDIEIRIVSFASVEYFLQCDNSFSGFSYLVEGRNPQPNQLLEGIEKAQENLRNFIKSGAAVDEWMQDQLIIYMALAKLSDPSNISRIKTITPTDHTTSAIHVAELFTPANKFQIKECDDGTFDIIL